MNFKQFGLTELTQQELLDTDGGSFWKWLGLIGVGIAITGALIASGGLAAAGFVTALVSFCAEVHDQIFQKE